ncbi:MAG: bifunctional diaminohydroxyphosphoribosylaminopyrimidine deaminase/5-amino-6-(5-phosphoribosylamino)uracil reductase RibD [Terriglobia bacterium]
MAKPPRETGERFMRQALELAARAERPPYPNPWVGCVMVRGGEVIGQGWHRGPGTNHAEIEALARAGPRARGATLYVTLEPCSHYGRTPPCTQAILDAGIREVIYAIPDPNPHVSGSGGRILQRRGVRVRSGMCQAEASALNEVYLKYCKTRLPFVTVKTAASLDGKIATRSGESKWITGEAARAEARKLRATHQAVLAGIKTVLADDPHLGPRLAGAAEPQRVVLDSHLRTPVRSQVVQSGRCVVACTEAADRVREFRLTKAGAQVWRFPGSEVPLGKLLQRLAREGIISVLVEGGSEVLGSFFDSGHVDRVFWFLSPIILGSAESKSAVAGEGAARLTSAWRLRQASIQSIEDSFLLTGNVSEWALAKAEL